LPRGSVDLEGQRRQILRRQEKARKPAPLAEQNPLLFVPIRNQFPEPETAVKGKRRARQGRVEDRFKLGCGALGQIRIHLGLIPAVVATER